MAWHGITLHYITLHYITLHYTTLHYITLHYITLHYTTLHYTTLHYITLHYITYTLCIKKQLQTFAGVPPRCHQSTCFGCAKKLQLAGGTCPICRARAPWIDGKPVGKPGEAMETEGFCHSKWWIYMDLYGFIWIYMDLKPFCNMM